MGKKLSLSAAIEHFRRYAQCLFRAFKPFEDGMHAFRDFDRRENIPRRRRIDI